MNDTAKEDQNQNSGTSQTTVGNPLKEAEPIVNSENITPSEIGHDISPELSSIEVRENPFPHDQIKLKSDSIQKPQASSTSLQAPITQSSSQLIKEEHDLKASIKKTDNSSSLFAKLLIRLKDIGKRRTRLNTTQTKPI